MKTGDATLDATVATHWGATTEQKGYNPSAWRKRVWISLLATLAFLIAGYMALYQWRIVPHAWDPVFGQGTQHVLDSHLSRQMRSWILVPDASLGALAYLGDIILGLAGSERRWQFRPWLVLAFGLNVIPLGIVSAILVGLQGLIVGSWCFLCLCTASISLVLAGMASREVGATIQLLWQLWQRTRDIQLLWDTFSGRPSSAADKAAGEIIWRHA